MTWRVLHTVELEGPMPVGILTRIEGTSPATTTDVVNRLVAEGYMTRRQDPKDGRSRIISITDKGRQYCRDSERVVGEGLVGVLNDLSGPERRVLLDALPVLEHTVTVLRHSRHSDEA